MKQITRFLLNETPASAIIGLILVAGGLLTDVAIIRSFAFLFAGVFIIGTGALNAGMNYPLISRNRMLSMVPRLQRHTDYTILLIMLTGSSSITLLYTAAGVHETTPNPYIVFVLSFISIAIIILFAYWLSIVRTREKIITGNNQFPGKSLLMMWAGRGNPVTPAGTIILGYPDGWRNRLSIPLLFILGIPLMLSLFYADLTSLISLYTEPATFYGIFLSVVLWNALLSIGSIKRSRYLWLRLPGDRRSIWKYIEYKLISQILLLNTGLVIFVIPLFYFNSWTVEHGISLVFTCAAFNFLVLYSGLWFNLPGKYSLESSVFKFISVIILSVFTAIAITSKNTPDIIILSMVFIAASLIFRHLVTEKFKTIDWCKFRKSNSLKQMV